MEPFLVWIKLDGNNHFYYYIIAKTIKNNSIDKSDAYLGQNYIKKQELLKLNRKIPLISIIIPTLIIDYN